MGVSFKRLLESFFEKRVKNQTRTEAVGMESYFRRRMTNEQNLVMVMDDGRVSI